jgi:hypothetical protein
VLVVSVSFVEAVELGLSTNVVVSASSGVVVVDSLVVVVVEVSLEV